ncbi:hypothetical protein NA56DRAFT_5488 [Hyaloscypha hepaticicola]|uniref:F-box domain-containing protein n=1 Tax=Hyaloscypha hepaticicola TaxID=2082293 RepID=A0A2J6QPQ0_9HELO|nr:hypothetical protein NA56DRAFT_5488 [Hyaloscypha hepaticicola]
MASAPDTASTTATVASCPVSHDTLADTASASSSTEIVPANFKSFDKRFPPEIHLVVFERIDDAVTSTCLGLTCKSLYEIH